MERIGINSHRAVYCVLLVVVPLFFSFIFWQFMHINGRNDLASHIEYAKTIKSFSDIDSPHFLFQLLIKSIHSTSGFSFELSSSLLLGACYGAMAVLIAQRLFRQSPHLNPMSICASSFFVLVASHIFIATIFVPNFYYNYLAPIVYHNPTQQLNKLFSIAIWFVYCDFFLTKDHDRSLPKLLLLSALCVVSAVAKPSFLIAFLPISGMIALVDLWRGRWSKVLSYAFAVLPVAFVLFWQFASHYGASTKGGIIFAPLVIFPNPQQYVMTIPLSLAFPIATTIWFWKEARISRSFQMAWGFMLLALFYTLFLAESQDTQAGNFAWTAQTGAFLLYVESLLLMMRCRAGEGRFRLVPTAVFASHVVCGFIFAGASAFWPAPTWL